MPKGVEKKSEKRPAFRFVFEDFLVTKLQAQYRIVTEPCGPLLTGMGTVAGRPKAIGYAAPVPGCWRDNYGYDQFLIIPTWGGAAPPPCPLKINFF